MSFYYTSDELIKSVKSRAAIPSSQNRFKNEDFLRFANEEMAIGIVPSILRNHEDYFLVSEDINITQGKTKYEIPYRAIGNKIRDVSIVDSNGVVFETTRIGIGDVAHFNNTTIMYTFYVANNEICLVPDTLSIQNGNKLRISYYIRPNTLVLLEDVAVISSIDFNTGIIQLSQLPTDFSTSLKFDLIKAKSPHKSLRIELTATGINTTSKTITFNISDLPANLEAGDHVSLATESAIPQIPSDMHMILAHRVATRVLEAQGDTEGLQNANQKLAELEQQTNTLIDNRVEDAPRKIVNRRSILRNSVYSRYRR
jgi:hypothetical protein